MTGKEILEQLVKEGIIVKLGEDSYVISNKAKREQVIPDEKPEESVVMSPRELLEKFIKDSRIPYRIKTFSGAYFTPAAISDYACKYFYKALKEYKYEDMVMATNLYYVNPKIARKSLTNYFKEGIFTQIMAEYVDLQKCGQAPKTAQDYVETNKVNSISL